MYFICLSPAPILCPLAYSPYNQESDAGSEFDNMIQVIIQS